MTLLQTERVLLVTQDLADLTGRDFASR